MPNPLYTDILNIYDLLTHFLDNIFKRAKALSFYAVKKFRVFQSNANNSIYYYSFACTQLDGYTYDI